MKLKGLEKRKHNILFHTHTVSGIVISFALFVCFFAGAFALFRGELYRWENPTARYESPATVDVDRAMKLMETAYPDMIRHDRMSIIMPKAHNPELNIYAFVLQPDSTKKSVGALINTRTYELTKFEERKTHMADTIYELHYFRQIPFGRYISGLVALFFLFATVTGLLIHWKDMFRKFWALRTTGGWKQLWKDAHTTLAFIGLPFQIIYGVTGALLGLSILLLAPSVLVLFDGDDSEVREMIDPFFAFEISEDSPRTEDTYGFNKILKEISDTHPDYNMEFIRLKNYGHEDAVAAFRLIAPHSVGPNGSVVYGLTEGKLLHTQHPKKQGYSGAYDTVLKLHYATFGGVWLKWVYFVLTLLTCFMIIAGVLLWQTSRDNKKYTDAQRRFHYRVTKIYLAICLSMFPAIALIFLANIAVPLDFSNRVWTVNAIFFIGWLILIVAGMLTKSFKSLTYLYVLLGGVIAVLIPVANGIVTGDWFWTVGIPHMSSVVTVDLCWLVTGVVAVWIWIKRKSNIASEL